MSVSLRGTAGLALLALLCIGQTVRAQNVNLGAAANYALLGLDNGTVTVNSGSVVVGDFGYCRGVTSTTNQKLGDDGNWTGTAYVHSLVAAFHASPNFVPSGGIVTNPAEDARLDLANADALSLSAWVDSLPPTEVLGPIADQNVGIGVLDGMRTVHVIDATTFSMNADVLELVGDPEDLFVFNVRGDFRFSQSEVRLVGVPAGNVLFNFPVTGLYTRNVLVNKSTTIFNGTILAPDLGGFAVEYHNPASFHGAIIARNILVHSDFSIVHEPFRGHVCTGVTASMNANLPACNSPQDPVLTSTLPIIGTNMQIDVQSQLPNSLIFLVASLGAPTPFTFPGSSCTVYVDLPNAFIPAIAMTDANGNFTFLQHIRPFCYKVGIEFVLQAAIIEPVTGPIPGVGWISNGLDLVIGLP